MNKFKYNIRWLSILFVLTGILFFIRPLWSDFNSFVQDCLIGIFSSVFLLLLIEIRDLINDKKVYGQLAGSYNRNEIYDVNHAALTETKYISLNDRYKKVNPNITLKYLGDRQYKIEADYEEGKVVGTFYLDVTNPRVQLAYHL